MTRRVSALEASNFLRFKSVQIREVPKSARLVVLLGPNGVGKSSVLEAFEFDRSLSTSGGRVTRQRPQSKVKVRFHPSHKKEERTLVRSAHRNATGVRITQLTAATSDSDTRKKLSENDSNQLFWLSRLRTIFAPTGGTEAEEAAKFKERRKILEEELPAAFNSVFPYLQYLGAAESDFEFARVVQDESREEERSEDKLGLANLSSGERSVFDLLVSVFIDLAHSDRQLLLAIDEPEAHLAPEAHRPLLDEVVKAVKEHGQVWIASHSLPMLSYAYELWRADNDSVAFIDLSEVHGRDPEVELEPEPSAHRVYEQIIQNTVSNTVGIAPSETFVCEGSSSGKGGSNNFDSKCMARIFAEKYPHISFVSAGGKGQLEEFAEAVRGLGPGIVRTLRDGDQMTEEVRGETVTESVRVLSRGCIEDYLTDDMVIKAFFAEIGEAEADQDDETGEQDENQPDQDRDRFGEITAELTGTGKKRLGLLYRKVLDLELAIRVGDTSHEFARVHLAPALVETSIYRELEGDLGLVTPDDR